MPKYRVLEATRHGLPVIIVVDDSLKLDPNRASFPELLTIRLPLRSFDQSTGLCDQPESARLDLVEDALLFSLDHSRYRHVGHVTGNGAREVLLYVDNADSMIVPIQSALDAAGEPSATVSVRDDPDWEVLPAVQVSAAVAIRSRKPPSEHFRPDADGGHTLVVCEHSGQRL